LGFEVMNITPVMDTFTLDPTYLEGTVGQYWYDRRI
jgi:hypothetical protein